MHAVALKYIDRVASAGSIRKAAETLNVASSAVNRQILNLERELGIQIFQRLSNGVRVTPAGSAIVHHARETLTKWHQLQREVSSMASELHGEVRITALASVMTDLLPRALETIVRLHPGISFYVNEASPLSVAAETRAERPDISIQFLDRRDRGYHVMASINSPLGIIVARDHPLAEKRSVTLTDCSQYMAIISSEPWLLEAAAESEFSHSGAVLRTLASTNSVALSQRLVSIGNCYAFGTPLPFLDELMSGRLKYVELEGNDRFANEVGLLVSKNAQSDRVVSAVADEIAKGLVILDEQIKSIIN